MAEARLRVVEARLEVVAQEFVQASSRIGPQWRPSSCRTSTRSSLPTRPGSWPSLALTCLTSSRLGPQYRSVVFYTDEGQKEETEAVIESMADHFSSPIVTEVKLLTNFFVAEDYHHDYFANNPGNPYCRVVVAPKIAKTRAKHASLYG